MSWQAWFTLALVAVAVYVLARDRLPPAPVILGATVTLLIVGIISPEQAFAGFSNPAPITVGALFVVARAVEVTGALEAVVGRLMGKSEKGPLQLARIVGPTAFASAFLNNTPLVAMSAPEVAEWADRRGLPASRYLIPLSYAAILGGVITVLGTSTNLVVSGLLVEAGFEPIALFEITKVGLPLAAAGCLVIVALAGRLLPDRQGAREGFDQSVREFTVAMRVLEGGPLDGSSLEEGGLRALQHVYCVQIDRGSQVIAPVAPTEVLRGGDELTFVGKVDTVVDLQRQRGLTSSEVHHAERLGGADRAFFECVVGDQSSLVGRTLKEVEFRATYQAAVLAIHRAGHRIDAKLGDVRLRTGDTLLLLADRGFRSRYRESGDFLLIAGLGQAPAPPSRKAPLVGAIVFGVVVLAGVGLVPILEAALGAAILLVAVGALSLTEARRSVDIDVLIVIAAAFGLSAAVTESGLADALAGSLLAVFAPFGAIGALVGVLLATMALTEVLTNNAAAVLLFPIAMSTAAAVGADPRPFAIMVLLGASLSFLTPIGYQTNLMVYGLGGYRFGDYARLGLPLNLVVFTLALLLVPQLWPL